MQHTRKHSTVSIFLKTYVSHHARLFVVLKESYSNRNRYGRAPLPGLESEKDNDTEVPAIHSHHISNSSAGETDHLPVQIPVIPISSWCHRKSMQQVGYANY